MSIEHIDWNYTVNKPHGSITLHKEYNYLEGLVSTRYGYVAVYAQGCATSRNFSQVIIILNGRSYVRGFDGKRYTARGLVTKANQFAKEIANANKA